MHLTSAFKHLKVPFMSNSQQTDFDRRNMTQDQQLMLDMALNGECSMSYVIDWAIGNGMHGFAAYVRTF